MADKTFPEGFMVQNPSDRAPDFVKGRIGVRVDKFSTWAREHMDDRGWVNLDLLESRDGKLYAALNTYKKTADGDDVDKDGYVKHSYKPDISEPHHVDSPF